MNFLFILLVLTPFAFIPGESHPTPPNQSNTTPPFPMRDAQLVGPSTLPNQSNQTPSSAHPAPLEQQSNLLPPPGQSNSTPPFPVRVDHEIQPEQQCNPSPLPRSPTQPSPPGQSNTIPLIPVPVLYQGTSQPAPLIRVPWYRQFVAMEPPPHGPHRMDNLSLCVLNYFFAGGFSYTSSWSQRPNFSTSIYIQCFLNQVAFSLFLLANAVFPQTYPILAFIIDRFSFLLIVISAYLASMPMFPPYFAIIMFLIVFIVYIFVRYRG